MLGFREMAGAHRLLDHVAAIQTILE